MYEPRQLVAVNTRENRPGLDPDPAHVQHRAAALGRHAQNDFHIPIDGARTRSHGHPYQSTSTDGNTAAACGKSQPQNRYVLRLKIIKQVNNNNNALSEQLNGYPEKRKSKKLVKETMTRDIANYAGALWTRTTQGRDTWKGTVEDFTLQSVDG